MNTHNAEISNGIYKDNIGTTTFKAYCNDTEGFAIYAIGFTDDEYGKTVLTNSILGSTHDILTGTATNGEASNWAMKLTATAGTYMPIIVGSTDDTTKESTTPDFSNYANVPTDYTKVAYRTSNTDQGTDPTGSSLTSTYAAYISPVQVAGTYTGQVKYTLVHPQSAAAPTTPLKDTDCPKNNICYAPNASDIVGSMSSLGTISASATAGKKSASSNSTAELIAPNYSRTGYGFAGWSTDFEADSNSTIYGPNETISTNPSDTDGVDISTQGLILYPVWVESTGTIQDWTSCDSLTQAPTDTRATLSSMTALTDQRDNNTYTVARLADGNCWMTENLRLDAEYTRGESNKALAQGYGTSTTYGNFIGLADTENANFTNTTPDAANNATNSLYSSDGSTTINIGTSSYPAYRMPRYNNNNTNRDLTASYNGTGSSTYYQWYSYGNYYTWPAAIADTSYYNTNNQSVTNTSLCPTGWHLPLGGDKNNTTNSDFWKLSVATIGAEPANTTSNTYPYYTNNSNTEGTDASKALRAYPNNFVYSGYFSTSSAVNRGSSGNYWSSTANNNNNSYNLNLNSTNVNPGTNNNNKNNGRTVRCVISS